jgi:hypothetical protein
MGRNKRNAPGRFGAGVVDSFFPVAFADFLAGTVEEAPEATFVLDLVVTTVVVAGVVAATRFRVVVLADGCCDNDDFLLAATFGLLAEGLANVGHRIRQACSTCSVTREA